ncbi:MAG: FAD-dependent oxidoreductase [Proteobacteria bacterium]|nr:FAD-dependent oxidoreductase [Pseudomonadota bacterium]
MARFATDRLRSADQIERWDAAADVVVAGLGSAGACAAIEAHRAGARVVALEGESEPGGTSATSAGQLYLGGGTGLQKACGFEDTPEAMANYMKLACGPGADEEKIELFAQRSVEHYEWLVDLGVPFKPSFVPTTEATNPPGDDGLTYTGSELVHPWVEHAPPAPRGHNVRCEGSSGHVLMRALLAEVERQGVEVRTGTKVERLAIDGAGRVVGVGASRAGAAEPIWIRAEGGVVLCTGGFGFNREMLARHAPRLLECLPVGTPAEDGLGLRLGLAAGGDALRMSAGCVILGFSKPRSLVRGILVDARGQRFVNEDVYQAVAGDAGLYRADGCVYLILDAKTWAEPVVPYPIAGEGDSPAELERALDLPRGNLAHTLELYNRHAADGEDPIFRKGSEWLVPLDEPPLRALDLRCGTSPYPFFTLGGLRTSPAGQVLTPEGEAVAGLYAAGRAASGLPAQGYNSGMSLSDCTFFGRLAGRSAAGGSRNP